MENAVIRRPVVKFVKRFLQPSANQAPNGFYPALGGIVLVIVVLLVPVGKPIRDPWGAGAWNVLHLPGFFLLTRSLMKVFERLGCEERRRFYSAMVGLGIGLGTEVLQGTIGRSGSLDDLILDLAGVSLALIWPGDRDRWTRARRTGFCLVLVGGLAFAFTPAIRLTWSQTKGRAQLSSNGEVFPGATPELWKGQGKARVKWERDQGVLRVRVEPGGAYGGLNFLPGRQDWSAFSTLELTLQNPGIPFLLGVRIDDEFSADDRVWFSGSVEVGAGDSVVQLGLPRLPAAGPTRTINLSRISRLVLFVGENGFPVEFSVKSVVLR